MRYRDLAAAVDWLCATFGFDKQVAVSGADGGTVYAQLTYGPSMVMLGAVRETDLDRLLRQPDEVGGIETQSCYVVVDDIDAHYARTVEAGAEILLEVQGDGFGRRGYSCRDPQGHIWNFGTYNPWKGRVPASYHTDLEHASMEAARRKTWLKAAAALGVVLAGLGVWWITSGGSDTPGDLAGASAPLEQAAPVGSPGDGGIAETFRADLEAARTAKAEAERASEAARAELDLERTKKEAAQRAATKLEQELTEQRNALQTAVRGMEEARLELAKARDEKASLEKSLNEGRRAEASPAASGQNNSAAPAPIETSAVETTATAQSSDSSAPQAVTAGSPPTRAAVRRSGRRYASRIRRPIATVPRPGQTTYLTELHDVPWPYSIWEPRRR
jgi:uncharacterized glyoxalase superfamily protein PhnB